MARGSILEGIGELSIMHMSFVRLASVTAIGVLSALAVPAATPASAQCEPSECAGKASKHKPGPMGMATSAGEFSTATQAKAHCPSDTVVWVNTKSHIYNFAGTRGYGSKAPICARPRRSPQATAPGQTPRRGLRFRRRWRRRVSAQIYRQDSSLGAGTRPKGDASRQMSVSAYVS
jgi:hypothetical protein